MRIFLSVYFGFTEKIEKLSASLDNIAYTLFNPLKLNLMDILSKQEFMVLLVTLFAVQFNYKFQLISQVCLNLISFLNNMLIILLFSQSQ